MKKWISNIIVHFERLPENFWGTIEIKFQNGYPSLITETKTTKLNGIGSRNNHTDSEYKLESGCNEKKQD